MPDLSALNPRDIVNSVDGLTEAQRAILAAYWFRRSEGEMTSFHGFQHVLADLRAEGSPAPICELAERAVRDEYQHALFCREWAIRFGHPSEVETRERSREPVRFRGASDQENRVLRILLCCFTETVGCFILRHVRKVVTDPELRRLNQRHLADELQHSRVGWAHLSTLAPAARASLEPWMAKVLAVLPQACCEGPELDHEELVPFGYFTPRLLRAAHDEAVREVILPGLTHLGLQASA
ncbi:MAG TPA: hypothetical protein VGQ57_14275 [Polyangiaceae bacterium]|jgi:hypothetical protein|nr:hypothetical protein [Polyangiaceae bacterium]